MQHAVGHVHGELLVDHRHLDQALGQEGQRAAGVRENPLDVRKLDRRAAEHDIDDGARGVGAKLHHGRRGVGQQAAAAIGHGRVGVDDSLAPVELGENRRERRMAQPFITVAGEQADAVGLERVQGVGDFFERRIGIVHRQHCKRTKAPLVLGHELGRIFIGFARKLARGGHIKGAHAGGGHRKDGGGDPRLVHVIYGLGQSPVEHGRLGDVARLIGVNQRRREEMVMGVDALGRKRRRRLAAAGAAGQYGRGTKGGGAAEKAAS